MNIIGMKHLFLVAAVAAALIAGAKDQYDIRPEETADKAPTAAEWQSVAANAKAIAVATAPEELAGCVISWEAGTTLLAQLKGAYLTDPLLATKVAAVTQYVMALKGGSWWQFWKPSVPVERVNWVNALLATVKDTKDPYVAVFCLDQLRWCGCAKCVDRVNEAVSGKDEKWVKDFAELVVRELATR